MTRILSFSAKNREIPFEDFKSILQFRNPADEPMLRF